jgi:hypothetical protein
MESTACAASRPTSGAPDRHSQYPIPPRPVCRQALTVSS